MKKDKKHKRSAYFTLMLVPETNEKIKSIRVSKQAIILLGFFVLIISSSIFFLSLAYAKTGYQYLRSAEKYKQENFYLLDEKEDLIAKNIELAKHLQNTNDFYQQNLEELKKKSNDLEREMMQLASLKHEIVSIMNTISYGPIKKMKIRNVSSGPKTIEVKNLKDEQAIQILASFSSNESDSSLLKQDYEQIKSNLISYQNFLQYLPYTWPAKGPITSEFGYRKHPFTKKRTLHAGIDIKLSIGTPVQAGGKGVVSFVGEKNGYGKIVIIDHGYGFESYFAHLSKALVKEGDIVNRGQVVALSGNTGRTTGPHLHYEIRYQGESRNPREFLTKK